MEKKEVTVFITKDGRKFFTEEEAKGHEERLSITKAYKVSYGPDLTETGRLSKIGYLIVEARWSNELWAEDWLYRKFGSRIVFVQGVSPTVNWSFQRIGLEEVNYSELLGNIRK
ncbi:hypothetical protein MXL46_11305 [Heyndrickxia sporothermodurans]|uniref:Phage protein n=1 Tax=Siminovitchia thermophila TaxID=1245522 RepID=A0ABS2R9T9_9BACI|nr:MULTISPECIES: hypothetical protein [Bacillaceae]MBM7715366.1 hypothetical protein [Siminovitchia thermophila]MEB6549673.1 hypothetical protein [Heyndrickxia sporothermodurans]